MRFLRLILILLVWLLLPESSHAKMSRLWSAGHFAQVNASSSNREKTGGLHKTLVFENHQQIKSGGHFAAQASATNLGPFGEPIGASGEADACPFRYQTKWFDAESEHYYFGYRYYDPRLGRWLSRDPLGEEGGFNLYAYVGNDPVNRHDPLGLAELFEDGKRIFVARNGDRYLVSGGEDKPLSCFGTRAVAEWIINLGRDEETKQRFLRRAFVEMFGENGEKASPFIPIETHFWWKVSDVVCPEETRNLSFALGAMQPNHFRPDYGGLSTTVSQKSTVTQSTGAQISKSNPRFRESPHDGGEFLNDSPGSVPGPIAPSGGRLILHQDQKIMNNYQRYYNDAWIKTVERFNAGKITIPAGQNWKTVLGQHTDATARARLKNYLSGQAIPEGPGTNVLVNRWLRDPSGSGAYRIPDVRLQQTGTILDGTIGNKTPTSPQILDFIDFSGGNRVNIVKPTVGPGS